jgi:hypothetical protein
MINNVLINGVFGSIPNKQYGKRLEGVIIPESLLEHRIRIALRKHLRKSGFKLTRDGKLKAPYESKEALRGLHYAQRQEQLKNNQEFVANKWGKLSYYFADGCDVRPNMISPRLDLIQNEGRKRDLFKLATLGWSVPVSNGYGRRMRFLIWDDYNGKLIGIMALGDPVFNLKVRDSLIRWNAQERKERLVNIMDAYVLGAVPPYSNILGGKLVACLVRTREVVDIFAMRYGNRCGTISKQNKNAQLVLVTTTSALGRSSIYNRLKIDDRLYFEPIGYTEGWGHFHIPDSIFDMMCDYLESVGDDYAKSYSFGNGPNWRIRVIRKCINKMGMNNEILKHGIRRQVFASRIADNAFEFLSGKQETPEYGTLLSVPEVSRLVKERWIIPRANRNPEYLDWKKEQYLHTLEMDKNSLSRGALI